MTRSELERLKYFMRAKVEDIAYTQPHRTVGDALIEFAKTDLFIILDEFAENLKSTGDLT